MLNSLAPASFFLQPLLSPERLSLLFSSFLCWLSKSCLGARSPFLMARFYLLHRWEVTCIENSLNRSLVVKAHYYKMWWFKFMFLEMRRRMPHGEKRRWGLMSGKWRCFWRQAEANDTVPFHQVSSEVSINFPPLPQHRPQVQLKRVHRTESTASLVDCRQSPAISSDQRYMCSASCVGTSKEDELPLETLFREFFFFLSCQLLQSAFWVENTWRFFSSFPFSSSSPSPKGTGVLAVLLLQAATH